MTKHNSEASWTGPAVALLLALSGCTASDPAVDSRASELRVLDPLRVEREALQAWNEGRREALSEIDAAAEQALRDGYSASPESAEGHERIVRTALAQWVRRLRQHLGDPMHTAVPAFAEDPQCQGSLIGDGVLIDYLEALAGGEDRERRVEAALATIARHMACLGETQSSRLATMLVVAFEDVRATLVLNGREPLVAYVAQAVSVPFLLVHDVERQHGATAPLSGWFAAYEEVLREGARTQHHPAAWHGLWLYDRMTGRLRGFRDSAEPRDENEVDLDAFFHTVGAPAELDEGSCSFAEMVQRGRHEGAYLCLAHACAEPNAADNPACTARPDGGAREDQQSEGSLSLPALDTSSPIDCVSTQSASAFEQSMTCIMEATGLGASPLEQITKELQEATLAGVKIGDDCTMGKSAADIQTTYDASVQAARDKYEQDVTRIRETIEDFTNDLRYSQARRDAAALAVQQNPSQANLAALAERQAKVDQNTTKLNEALAQEAADLEKAADARDQAIEAAEDQREQEQAANGQGTRCVQGAAGCGNGCGAMATQAMQALECVVGAGNGKTLDPLMGPGGCKGVCDPMDPATELPSGGLCISEIVGNPGAATSAACWAVRCGPETNVASGAGAACCGAGGVTATGASAITPMCEVVDCEGGGAVFRDGHCTCADPMLTTPSVPPVVPGGPRF